jgi:hypothetical protein
MGPCPWIYRVFINLEKHSIPRNCTTYTPLPLARYRNEKQTSKLANIFNVTLKQTFRFTPKTPKTSKTPNSSIAPPKTLKRPNTDTTFRKTKLRNI